MEQNLVEQIIKRVLEKLSRPRVGMVCCSHVKLSAVPYCEAFDWVLYPRTPLAPEIQAEAQAMPSAQRPIIHPICELKRPEDEAELLKTLVVMAPCLSLMSELVTAVPRSLEGALILGCLWRSVPVLIDGTRFGSWMQWGSSPCGAEMVEKMNRLRSWGVTFLGMPDGKASIASAPVRKPAPVDALNLNAPMPNKVPEHIHVTAPAQNSGMTLVLTDPGWLTWTELSRRYNFAKIKTVRLEGRARLTPEVIDQLARRRIVLIQN